MDTDKTPPTVVLLGFIKTSNKPLSTHKQTLTSREAIKNLNQSWKMTIWHCKQLRIRWERCSCVASRSVYSVDRALKVTS